MKRIGIIFALSAALGAALLPAAALARSLTNPIWDGRYPVSCNIGGTPCTFCDLLKVGANIVDALTLLVIPIGAAVIVYGGFRIMTAGSSPTGLSAGQNAMKMAGIGIAISLSGWLIVNTVFSLLSGGGSLTAIRCPAGDIFTKVPYTPAGADCSQLRLTMQNHSWGGVNSIFNVGQFPSGFPIACDGATQQKVQQNLDKIYNELLGPNAWLKPPRTNRSIVVNSAFRPAIYQAHLREVYDKNDLLTRYPTLNTNCRTEAGIVQNEFSRHGLGSTVAEPGESPHGRGSGVDISIGDCGNGPRFGPQCGQIYSEIDAILQSTEIISGGVRHVPKLKWQRRVGDEVHFNLLPTQRQENTGC